MPPDLIPRHYYRRWPETGAALKITCAVDGGTYHVPPGAFVRSDLLIGVKPEQRRQFSGAIKARYLPVEDPEQFDGLAIVLPMAEVTPAGRGANIEPKSVLSDTVLSLGKDVPAELGEYARRMAHVSLCDEREGARKRVVLPIGTTERDLGPGWLLRAPVLAEESPVISEPQIVMPHSKSRCAVIVTVFNAPEVAVPCIESIARHTDPRHTLIVVDDHSEPAAARMVDAALLEAADGGRETTYIGMGKNVGYREAINAGIEAAFEAKDVDSVCVVNSDVLVTRQWLERMLVAVDVTGAGLVNAHCNDAALMSLPLAGHKIKVPWRGLKQGIDYRDVAAALLFMEPIYPSAVTSVGNCMLITREAWAHGPFDPVYGRGYGEECELWAKVIEGGGRAVIADDAYVFHESHASGNFGVPQNAAEATGVKTFLKRHGRTYAAQQHNLAAWPSNTAKARGLVASAKLTGLPVQFFAVDIGPYGGVFCIVRLAAELRRYGISAQVGHLQEPHIPMTPPFGWLRHRSESELPSEFTGTSGWDKGVLVATHWSTGEVVKGVAERNAGVVPMAFWQDREDLFKDDRGRQTLPLSRRHAYLGIEDRVYNAPWVFESAEAELGIKATDYTRHIPVGVDCRLFRPSGHERKQGPVRILSMWRPHTPRRGSKLLASVYAALRSRWHVESVSLEVYGWGGSVPPGVKNHGQLSQRKVAALMRQVDILIEPSSYQGFGLPGLEAMASGVAVVSTPTKGVDAYREEGALIVTADHSREALCGAVGALIEDEAARSVMGIKGRSRAQQFDWSRIGARWVVYLRDLWAAKGTDPAYQPELDRAAVKARRLLGAES